MVTPDYVKVIPNEGMPISKSNGTQKGAMQLKFDVALPRHLTEEQKAALKGILRTPPAPFAGAARAPAGAVSAFQRG